MLEQDPDAEDYFGVFMMPGMFHCRGGAGPDRFDAMTAIIEWTEKDLSPQELATWRIVDGKPTAARPACRYPAEAQRTNGDWTCVTVE